MFVVTCCLLFTDNKQALPKEKNVMSSKTTKTKAKQSEGNMHDFISQLG